MRLPFSKSSTRRSPRRDAPPSYKTVATGSLVVLFLLATGVLMLRLYNGVPTTSYGQVYVTAPTIGNLLPHDAVRIGGTRVGQVLKLDVDDDGQVRADLQLQPGTELPKDTKVEIRANGLLGARFVSLVPGKSKALLPSGATIEGGASSYTFGLPEAVAVFDEDARAGLQDLVSGLAQGTRGNGASLNQAVGDLAPGAQRFDAVARAVLDRRGAAARLLPSLESAIEPLDRATPYGPRVLQGAVDTLRPVVAERDALEATIAEAPGALTGIRTGLDRGVKLLGAVRRLSASAARTLPGAPAGLGQLSALLAEGRAPLRAARPTVARLLEPTLDLARTALLATEPVVGRVRSGIDTARPTLGYIGRYGCDLANAGASLRSMTGFGQAGSGINGPAMAFRLQAVIPAGLEAVGVRDDTGLLKREAYEAPCKYVSRPYPQNLPLSALSGSARRRSHAAFPPG